MTTREQLLLAYASATSAKRDLGNAIERLGAFAHLIGQAHDPRLLAARAAYKHTVSLVEQIDGALKWLGE